VLARSVNHVSFAVDDLEASLHFYQEVLGLSPIARPDFGIPGAWLEVGGTQVHLIQTPEGVDVGSGPGRTLPLANHTAFQVDDYTRALEHLKSHGLEVMETNPEQGQLFVSDPSGNVIEFIAAGAR